MSAMVFQITGVSIVCSTVCSQAQFKENIKAPCHWPFLGRGGGVPSQRAGNAENVSR